MKSILLIFFTVIICSCSKEKSEKKSDLIHFNSKFITEPNGENTDSINAILSKDFEIEYLNDVIYISKIIGTNACGEYKGEVEIKNDSLILHYILISDEVCTSSSIERITYIVKNPKEKRFKIKLKES